MDGHSEYSEATAELIDKEVRDIIQQQYSVAKTVLEARRDLLEKSTHRLLEFETIAGEELKVLAAEAKSRTSEAQLEQGL